MKKEINTSVRQILIAVRVNAKEMHQLLALANVYTKGNVSQWVRKAAFNYKPLKTKG